MNSRSVCDEKLRARIEAEYREMPGLSLTVAQARRLWALDSEGCAQILGELIDAGFLRCGADGRYRRNTGGDICHWRRRGETRADDCAARSPCSKFADDACEAFAAIVGAAARADGSVVPCETARLQQTLASLPVFRGKADESRRAMIERAVGQPPDNDGSLLRGAVAALPAGLRGTAFTVGIDVLLADGRLRASELRFVEELRRLLRVRRSFARKVLGVLGTKNLVWSEARIGI